MSASAASQALLVTYDPRLESFSYLSDMSDLGSRFERRPLWEVLQEDGITCAEMANKLQEAIQALAKAGIPQAQELELTLRHRRLGCRQYRVNLVCIGPELPITITLTDVAESKCADDLDELTGLVTRRAFCERVDAALHMDPTGAQMGGYAVVYLDMLHFKAINDMFGRARGDALLRFVADTIRQPLTAPECACNVENDHFAIFMRTGQKRPETLLTLLQQALQQQDCPMEVSFNAGIFVTNQVELSANTMIDRAAMAQAAIKGRYDLRYNYFTEDVRSALIGEQEIVGMMSGAMADKQFVVYYQPQYNHSTGMLVGAEGLVRWMHPDRGLIPPGEFIPIFEKNGFIIQLDMYVFEEACSFLKKCLDNHWAIVPVSTNFSRYTLFQTDFVEQLEAIRTKYDVPPKYLRVEMTESAMVGGPQYINKVIAKLHDVGYIIEMDDFGSGYSSLNVLKDIDLDIIKLDMQFLRDATEGNKGGTIISSVIRMAKWLNMPIIAEGVETVEQADFLRSIGCDYIQGYLYSRPLPEKEYLRLVSSGVIGTAVPQMNLIETLNAFNFWNPTSQETLIFSNYVGGASIFDYHHGKVEVLRVNKKYLQELGMNLSEQEIIKNDLLATMDEENRTIFLTMLDKAIQTMEEQECETWRDIRSSCCGEEHLCIRTTVQVIGISGDRYLFHAMIRNVTSEKMYLDSIQDNERRFKLASEQVNIYYWEYNIATREMRPCFRCMRDLGLPPLVTNYPEPLIESGAIPIEVADTYRAWLKDVVSGGTKLEAIVPLTENRIPFRFRYTLEYDENGHPIKAYGSAALIVD